jgi:type II secretory pathway pseudopilin PulG
MPPRRRLRLRDPHARRASRAFTLIQLLVVLGIIVTLMGLALPMVVKAYRTAIRTRTLNDLQMISTGLEAYRQDFGDYPRIDNDNTTTPLQLNQLQDRGARLLCRALIGPGPAVPPQPPTASKQYGPGFDLNGSPPGAGPDGADGPGFRVRTGAGGKVYGPYLQTDKFNLGGTDKDNFTDAVILDRDNNPILYYVATPNAVSTAAVAQFVVKTSPNAPPGNYNTHPLYNAFDNFGYGQNGVPGYLSDTEMQWVLGDRNNNGRIDPGETAATTAPYLLWTAGADGVFGRSPTTGKVDDVANFEFPPDIRK